MKKIKESKMKYYVMTIQRDEKISTVIDHTKSETTFLAIQLELGFKTSILWSKEITKEEYDMLIPIIFKKEI
jgi:hypothetical protein